MTNYRYDSEMVDDKKLWYVTERPTNQVIKREMTWDEASTLTKRLNGGQGFNGMTPAFFLERLAVSDC